jgi:transposase
MARKNLSFQKRQHFLNLIQGIAPEKVLVCPIDISKDFHVTLFHDLTGHPLSEYLTLSASKHGFEVFTTKLEQVMALASPAVVLIGMEPTNVYYEPWLHQLCQRYGSSGAPRVEVGLVNPAAVSANRRQQSLRFHKTDEIDTAAIGDLLMRGLYTPAHLSSPLCIQIKELSRSINDYRHQSLRWWNRLLSTLERVFPNLLINFQDESPLCKTPVDSVLLADLLHICPDPYRLLDLTTADLIELFHQQGRPLGPHKARKIAQAVQRALLLPKPYQQIHRHTLTHQLATLDFFSQQIQPLWQPLCHLIHQTPARHLLAIRGNSESLTAELIAALEDWNRYPGIGSVWKAAGLDPTQDQSGRRCARPRVSKNGSVSLRNAIYKLTASVVWHEPTFGIPCFERLLTGHGFVPTVLHVGRKLTNTALAILQSDTPFLPPFENYPDAMATLQQLQEHYLQQKRKSSEPTVG